MAISQFCSTPCEMAPRQRSGGANTTSGQRSVALSALWTLGHIGSSPTGFQFLLSNNVIPLFVDIAETSPVLSLRGTAFIVLGVISRTEQVRELDSATASSSVIGSDKADRFGLVVPQESIRVCLGACTHFALLQGTSSRSLIRSDSSGTCVRVQGFMGGRVCFSSAALLHG